MRKFVLSAVVLLLGGVTAIAHHAAADFDAKKEVIITGTITEVEWVNPHVRWHLDVTNPDREIEKWIFESSSPEEFRRAKVSQASAGKADDVVTIHAFLAKGDRKFLGFAVDLTYKDGRKVVAPLGDKVPRSQ